MVRNVNDRLSRPSLRGKARASGAIETTGVADGTKRAAVVTGRGVLVRLAAGVGVAVGWGVSVGTGVFVGVREAIEVGEIAVVGLAATVDVDVAIAAGAAAGDCAIDNPMAMIISKAKRAPPMKPATRQRDPRKREAADRRGLMRRTLLLTAGPAATAAATNGTAIGLRTLRAWA
jgi:hypothetical protein